MYMYIWISTRPWYFFHAKRLGSTAEEPRNGWLSVKDQRIGRFSCKRIQDKRLGKRLWGDVADFKKSDSTSWVSDECTICTLPKIMCVQLYIIYIYTHKTHHLSILICLLVFIIDVTGNILMDRNNEYKPSSIVFGGQTGPPWHYMGHRHPIAFSALRSSGPQFGESLSEYMWYMYDM